MESIRRTFLNVANLQGIDFIDSAGKSTVISDFTIKQRILRSLPVVPLLMRSMLISISVENPLA